MTEAPETQARKALIKKIEEIFSTEKFIVVGDRLSPSLGYEGTRIAVSPERRRPWSKDISIKQYEILVQFYGDFQLEVDPLQTVDPTKIEGYADRFCLLFEGNAAPQSNDTWYWTLQDLRYPNDPTGNKTRFEAILTVWGNG